MKCLEWSDSTCLKPLINFESSVLELCSVPTMNRNLPLQKQNFLILNSTNIWKSLLYNKQVGNWILPVEEQCRLWCWALNIPDRSYDNSCKSYRMGSFDDINHVIYSFNPGIEICAPEYKTFSFDVKIESP